MPRDAPLPVVLSLIAPTRVLLIGPAGSALAVAAQWARRQPGITLLRQGDARGHLTGDLLICERAALLPAFPVAEVTALVPAEEQASAASRGWSALVAAPEGFAVVRPGTAASEPVEPGLDAYARARLWLSHQLEWLASAPDGPGGPPVVAGEPPHRLTTPEPPHGLTTPEPPHPRTAPARPRRRHLGSEVSILVPVHNAAAELRRCLESLARFTTWPAELVLIDDASSDPEIAEILAEAAEFSGVRVLRNVVNLGFTATVNRGLYATDGDVVLLNSDTEVGPRWLEQLVQAAHGEPGVATVTPVSDNAGAFSVPEAGRPNPTPLALDTAGVARLVAQSAPGGARTPTGSGFCLYIRRAALEAVGSLDAEGFPRGYGEENDFCMRAVRAGWTHLVDGRTFVRHVRDASFGGEGRQLAGPARARLDERYPEYTDLVGAFVGGEPMTRLRAGVQEAYRSSVAPRPRILFAIHEGSGGTWVANLELMRALAGEWEPLMLSCDRRTLRLWRLQDGEPVSLRSWTLERRIRATDFSRDDYRAVVRSILVDYAVELVHVRHLFKHTFDLPALAQRLGIPVVLSFHDFYFVCPTINLLDDHDQYCGGECTPGDGSCRIPPAGLDGLPHLKHSYVHQWRAQAESMLRHVDAFVTTSEHARDVHRRWLPSLAGRPFALIEHGRSLTQRGGIAAAPVPDGTVRILVVANLDVHKGGDYIRALLASEHGSRLEFHLLGAVPDVYADLGVLHGSFETAAELPERAARIAPSFVGCFSVAAETYSHSLTEAWAMGVPVVATDLGALGERIRAHGGAVLLPVDDPAQAVRRICAAADDAEAYARLREQASLSGCASVPAMADAYAALYRSVIDDRRTFVAPSSGGTTAPLGGGVRRMLAVVAGADGRHPGSAFVRIIQRYRHPSVDWKLSLSLRAPEDDPVRPDTDLVLLQRTALDPGLTEHFVAALRHREIPLVVDLDDHLLLEQAGDADSGTRRDALARVLEAAQLVLVSTERLAQALRQWSAAVAVVPNLIDERLFLAGVQRCPVPGPRGDRPLQIVYVGSSTHARDLALIRPALAALERERPGRFELNVVGVEPAGADQEWYRRIVVPDRCKPYPQFVRWLRGLRPAWDVGVAPLRDDEFNRFKSDLKYLEYSALGLPAVYSDREPYTTVRDRITGLKVGDEVGDWTEALLRLDDDRGLRHELADNAFGEVTAQRLLRHGATELLQIFSAVAQRR